MTNTVYKGELKYGRRSTKPGGREVISASVPSLVSAEMWEVAQQTLAQNRIISENTERIYLLRSVIRCGVCGKTYVSCWGRGFVWYRCNGRLIDRSPIDQRCKAKSVRGPDLEELVWADVERFLRDPGDILEELSKAREMDGGAAIIEAEIVTLEGALVDIARREKMAADDYMREKFSKVLLGELMAEIVQEKEGVHKRLFEIQSSRTEPEEPPDADILEEVRMRLDTGLIDAQRQEVVRLLVKKITVHTEVTPNGKKAKVLIEYRFPAVVNISTDRDSWPPPA